MPRETYTSDRIAPPVGPFSAAVRAGELLYLSGQVAQDPATGKLVEGGVEAQALQIFRNVAAVLASAGKDFEDAVRVGVFLHDMADFKAVNAVYERLRATVPVTGVATPSERPSRSRSSRAVQQARHDAPPLPRPPRARRIGQSRCLTRGRTARRWPRRSA